MTMSDEERRTFKEQLDRIERCLIGDEAMGQNGLVPQVSDHDKRISRIERAGIYIAGVIATVGVIYRVTLDLWPKK